MNHPTFTLHSLILETHSLDLSNMFLPHFSCSFSCSCVTTGNFCQGVATKVPYIPWPTHEATRLEVHYPIRPNINEREWHFHQHIISKCRYSSLRFPCLSPSGQFGGGTMFFFSSMLFKYSRSYNCYTFKTFRRERESQSQVRDGIWGRK